jgi:uncharacterized SAM-binding protein YcdF (DUF218 family)
VSDADAIVVLGCALRPGGEPSPALQRRAALGICLYRAGRAPLLLLSGGGGEAVAMRQMALAAGVPEPALLCETGSRNTAENACFAASLLYERGLARVVLVSHAAHLLRARLLFRLCGVRVVGSAGVPARSATAAALLSLAEIAALPRSLLRILARRR